MIRNRRITGWLSMLGILGIVVHRAGTMVLVSSSSERSPPGARRELLRLSRSRLGERESRSAHRFA